MDGGDHFAEDIKRYDIGMDEGRWIFLGLIRWRRSDCNIALEEVKGGGDFIHGCNFPIAIWSPDPTTPL